MDEIRIQGARIHNLKEINLVIPKHQLIAVTGISGSGKSSLVFDILFEEGKNQYLRSIGILAGLNNEDRFDKIEGLGPTVAVRQSIIRQSNPRSTVGTKTGILNQLALIYASDGKALEEHHGHYSPGFFLYTTVDGMCLSCQGRGSYFDVNLEQLIPDRAMTLLEVYESVQVTAGFLRLLGKKYGTYFKTPFWELPEEIQGEVVYGTYDNGKQSYCLERILRTAYEKGEDVEEFYTGKTCPDCQGERIGKESRKVLLGDKQIGELGRMTLFSLLAFIDDLPEEELSQFARNVIKTIKVELKHLIKFRLGHLTLYREMATLSGGEIQRIFLHLHLKSGQDSILYVFDEPMAGLHPFEKQSMIEAVKELRDLGNTVIVVEHDKEMIQHADHIIEIGPRAGVEGGNVVFQGNYEAYKKADTLLSHYLSGKCLMPNRVPICHARSIKHKDLSETVEMGDDRTEYNRTEYNRTEYNRTEKFITDKITTGNRTDNKYTSDCLILRHASTHYLKDLTVAFPLHAMVGVAGVSGSGKSSLIEETLLKRLVSARKHCRRTAITGAERNHGFTGEEYENGIDGAEYINGIVKVSQEPIGRSASSTPATYIGIWDKIRELFAGQPEARERNMSAGHFSFHSKGACSDCGGSGYERIFLTSDFSVDKVCQTCHGKRFQEESLTVEYKGKTISDVLNLSITQAISFFADVSSIKKPLHILEQMGMGYLTLGQPSSSLSGGEAQRVKLAKELGRQSKGNLLYVLDEPTTGLSLYDTALLIKLLDQLVASGNSVIVIEHHVDVLNCCDYIIELGPGGGDQGGEIIAVGSPKELRDNPDSITGRYLI